MASEEPVWELARAMEAARVLGELRVLVALDEWLDAAFEESA